MNKYNNSKIYKLFSPSTGLTYIGSTCEKYLSRRLAGHVRNYKYYLKGRNNYIYITSFRVLECEDFKIELLEKVNVSDKDELRKKEGEYIKMFDCVNKRIEGRTKKECIEYNKEYREQNKDKIQKFYKEYYEKNKDKIQKSNKEYYEKNKDKIQKFYKEYAKKYREQNKDKIKQYKSEKIECEICGSCVRRTEISRHKKSKKCLEHQ